MLQQSNDKACTFYKCNNRTYYSAIVPLKTEEEDLRQSKGEIVTFNNINRGCLNLGGIKGMVSNSGVKSRGVDRCLRKS